MANHTKTGRVQYSRHLNTGLVPFFNGTNMSGSQMVRFSNGIGIFDGHFDVCELKPFENQTLKSAVFRCPGAPTVLGSLLHIPPKFLPLRQNELQVHHCLAFHQEVSSQKRSLSNLASHPFQSPAAAKIFFS